VIVGSHPIPDERSVAAGRAVLSLVASASPSDEVVVAISGGASALCEVPRGSLEELVARTRSVMASGAPIAELNRVRASMSLIKGGQLARACPGRVLTLIASDVVGDDVAVIGSGPTIAPERTNDRTILVASIRGFAADIADRVGARLIEPALTGDVRSVADRLASSMSQGSDPCDIAYGEPTLVVPDGAGEGGRAQQLALELARRFRGTNRAALVVGSDGIDGPPPANRPSPAGAFIDGTTWDAIIAAGIDPDASLERCDAGTALAAIGALVVTGPTGVNHADVVLLYGPSS
jgi:hydroxypyruvate reductase